MMKRLSGLLLLSTLVATPAWAFDADGDGTKDALDAFPCEPFAVGAAFYPAQGDHGMLMYEDLWPNYGDKDFNDAVIAYNYIHKLDAAGDVMQIKLTLNVLAIGAELRSGLGLRLPVPRNAVAGVSLSRITRHKDKHTSVNLAPSTSDTELVVRISNDLREFFADFGSAVNTVDIYDRLHGETVEVTISFWQPTTVDLSEAPYDLFLFRTDNPSHELHRPEYRGTAAMDTALFNTGDDGSTATRAFTSIHGLPFALDFPTLVPYPAEGVRIDTLFPNITAWASSGGATNQDFYTNGVDASAIFKDAKGYGPITPSFIGPDHLPAETGCIQDWGVAVEWGSVASRYSKSAVVDATGIATVTGYTRSAFTGQTYAGGLDAFVARYDTTSGNLIWATQFGSSGDDAGRDIVADGAHVYVVGDVEGAIHGQTHAGGADAFVTKLDNTGAVVWTRLFGGGANELGYGITVDAAGNVYIAGGSTSASLPGGTSPGNTPASFLVKFDADGTRLWTQHYVTDAANGTSYSYSTDVTVDPTSQDLYVVGTERRFTQSANAAVNQFLARHSAATGAQTWIEHIGDHGYRASATDFRYSYAYGVTADSLDGSAYVVGYWYGGPAVSAWAGYTRATGDASPDATIAKFANNGASRWQYALASTDGQEDFAWAVLADGVGGSVYVTGRTAGSLPGQANVGATDYFIRSYAYDGTERWTVQGGGYAFDSGHVAAVHNTSQTTGDVYVVGNATAVHSNDWSTWDIILTLLDRDDGSLLSSNAARRLGWVTGTPGMCSTTCGQGTAPWTVTCVRADGSTAPDSECSGLKHPGPAADCWDYSFCTQTWQTEVWSSCSTSCGAGTQTRAVYCERDDGIILPDSDCAGEPRPTETQTCTDLSECEYDWALGAWSVCSVSGCATGTQGRAVSCQRSDGASVADSFCPVPRPTTTQTCGGANCTPTTCADLLANDNTTSGEYTIFPNGAGTSGVGVYCDMTSSGGGWTNLDLANDIVHLENGHAIHCSGGLTTTANSVTCAGPYFDNDTSKLLYQFGCGGNDRSADYLLDHAAAMLGHNDAPVLGYAGIAQDGASIASGSEYCYASGAVYPWHAPQCAPYNAEGNGSCKLTTFTLSR
ncbi:MAG: LruC domain-containing protein [Deltaproteobacteria bacterium]